MLQIRAFKQPFRNRGISLFIDDIPMYGNIDQQHMTALPIKMRIVEPSEIYSTDDSFAPITIRPEAAQKLIDDLWDCGLRPSEGTGSAGQLAAVQKHLADFRTILFKKLNIIKESTDGG